VIAFKCKGKMGNCILDKPKKTECNSFRGIALMNLKLEGVVVKEVSEALLSAFDELYLLRGRIVRNELDLKVDGNPLKGQPNEPSRSAA
jgi:hypothetical protein